MNIVYESERINFINVSMDLLQDYLNMINDLDHVGNFIGHFAVKTVEEEKAWVEKKIINKDTVYSMIEKNTNKFIGNIEFMDVNNNQGELGISITASMQEKGFGKEAIKTTIKYGKEVLNLKKIILKAYLYNPRAIHVYERCGFVEYNRDDKQIYMVLKD